MGKKLPKVLRKTISCRPRVVSGEQSNRSISADSAILVNSADSIFPEGPQILNVYFPDHNNKLIHYEFTETSSIQDLWRDVLSSTNSPVATDMHDVYSLCIPSNGTNELRHIPIGQQVIWGFYFLSHEMEYRMLPSKIVEEKNLEDLYVRVHSSIHDSMFLFKSDPYLTGKQIFTTICEEFDILEEERDGLGVYYQDKLIPEEAPLKGLGIKQMSDVVFKRQKKFIIRLVDIAKRPTTPLELAGDVTVEKAIREILKWLGISEDHSSFGLLWRSSKFLMNPDLPIMPWLPPFSTLSDWSFKPNSELIFSALPGVATWFDPTPLLFLSTPEQETSFKVSHPDSFVKLTKIVLLAGEMYIATYRNVCEVNKSIVATKNMPRAVGTLFVTNYRLIMNSFSNEVEGGSHLLSVIVNVPLGHISRIILSKDIVDIHCKNQKIFGFQTDQAALIAQTIESAAFIPITECFAFKYCERYPQGNDGWEVFDFRREMTRQGIPNSLWRICTENEEYECTTTYPQQFVLPASFSNESLQQVLPFRSKGRIPVLTYLHTNGASITRCSQPQVGLKSKSNSADKELLKKIRQNSGTETKLWMLDARPKASAVANRVMDGGYETNYSNCKIKFCNIENIHVMRHSVKDLIQACNEYNSPYLSAVAASKWLDHIFTILTAAHKAAKIVLSGSSVMVHCSDGWDRTPQICALAQIMIDPYFRTIEGFEVLVEKDWLSFGHKFEQRLGHCSGDYADSERSPVFSQFLDCVWQIIQQFPNEFEYTTGFLKTVLYHSTSCRFGTFLFDRDCQRIGHQIHRQTTSLWTYINNNLYAFTNTSYKPSGTSYLKPFISDRSLEIWKDVYCFQSDNDAQFQYNQLAKEAYMSQLYQENQLLISRVKRLERLVKKTNSAVPPVPPPRAGVKQERPKKRSMSLLSSTNVRQPVTPRSQQPQIEDDDSE